MKKQPLLTNNKNSVQMAIFEHTSKEGTTWFSATIKRPYKDRNGQWQPGSYSRNNSKQLPNSPRRRFASSTNAIKQTRRRELRAAGLHRPAHLID
jgi:hypothetical protein